MTVSLFPPYFPQTARSSAAAGSGSRSTIGAGNGPGHPQLCKCLGRQCQRDTFGAFVDVAVHGRAGRGQRHVVNVDATVSRTRLDRRASRGRRAARPQGFDGRARLQRRRSQCLDRLVDHGLQPAFERPYVCTGTVASHGPKVGAVHLGEDRQIHHRSRSSRSATKHIPASERRAVGCGAASPCAFTSRLWMALNRACSGGALVVGRRQRDFCAPHLLGELPDVRGSPTRDAPASCHPSLYAPSRPVPEARLPFVESDVGVGPGVSRRSLWAKARAPMPPTMAELAGV